MKNPWLWFNIGASVLMIASLIEGGFHFTVNTAICAFFLGFNLVNLWRIWVKPAYRRWRTNRVTAGHLAQLRARNKRDFPS